MLCRMTLLVDDLCLSAVKGRASLLLLDLSVAFATTDHVILMRCFGAEIGMKGYALE